MKDQAILCTHCGELGWEILRFQPHVLWTKLKKYNNNVKLIVQTRPDRYDLYGTYANDFEPLNLDPKLKSDCFGIMGLDDRTYYKITSSFYNKYKDLFDIKEHIFPLLEKNKYCQKDQFSKYEMIYKFKPREENLKLVKNWIPFDKPIVALAPRYREGFFRNWPYWVELYNLIYNDEYLINNFTFILCGKPSEYIPDPENRFFDINNISLKKNTSLIGITIEIIKSSLLLCGSQSGLPNLSNLIGTPTLQFGHEQTQHEKTYNVKNTPTTFIKTGNSKSNYDKLTALDVFTKLKNLIIKGRKK